MWAANPAISARLDIKIAWRIKRRVRAPSRLENVVGKAMKLIQEAKIRTSLSLDVGVNSSDFRLT